MRYEEVRRLSGVESSWFRFKCWLVPAFRRHKPVVGNLSHLSDAMRRDIGLPDEVQHEDWRSLGWNGWR
jgi:hypothetical protein